MKAKFLLFTAFMLFLSAPAAFGQKDNAFLTRAINAMKLYAEKNPAEKVYLQLDKCYYAAGDDIWFKAYITAGSRHELSAISGVLNVELINSKNLVQQAIKLPLAGGLTWGDFKLPDTLNEGSYRLRAYTNWMRNAGPEDFYDRALTIENAIYPSTLTGNPLKAKGKRHPPIPAIHKYDVQFFPEGGSLVCGIASRVAFKVVGEDGLGREVKGMVVDEQNQEAARFETQHAGMGAFYLLPVAGKKYKAQVTFPDSSWKKVDLPVPLTKGYALKVNNSDSLNIVVQFEASEELAIGNADPSVILIAQSGGEICYAAKSKNENSSFTIAIPKKLFPPGIARFTVFSSSGEPLNERLAFIKNPNDLKVSVALGGEVFAPRSRMKIAINTKNMAEIPARGNFSVAVIDETKAPVDEASESNILTNLLLTSDLKGYVENPNYYFTAANKKTGDDLDLLMLTQGYGRFTWKQVLAGDTPAVLYQPEKALQITGHTSTLGGKPVPGSKVSLLSTTYGFFTMDTLSDNKGNFNFNNLQFKDSTKFIVQARTKKNSKNIRVSVDTTAPPAIENKYLPSGDFVRDTSSVYFSASRKKYLEEVKYGVGYHPKLLKEVKITARKPLLENSSNLNGPGQADQILLTKKIDIGCPTIVTCLQVLLRGVFFQDDPNDIGVLKAYVHDDRGNLLRMRLFVDGFEQSDDILISLPMSFVESVEVLKSQSYIVAYDGPALLINLKRNFNERVSIPNITSYLPKGYYKAREFYTPQYDIVKTNTQLKDLRSTIYWNPNLSTDKDGKASFEFFNADGYGRYRVTIEGIDEMGNLYREVVKYKVE